jgi:hypothetical protein
MSDYGILSVANKELMDRGLELGGQFIELTGKVEKSIDARIVAIGAATVAGCYLNQIKNHDLRLALCRHFAQVFFETAGVPLRVEGQQ